MKLLGENTGVYLCDLGLGSSFLDMIPESASNQRKKYINWIPLRLQSYALTFQESEKAIHRMGEYIYNTFNSQRVHNYNIKECL